ncbi:CDP-glycerol glycerophosphotransferase family protein [Natronoglycomyces albus]|uniref:CDP-glycerol glycerophosphotransferase family protein n=1 Tax=Natronoglycomyces albus TaxID=2811108 RepID=A0A895XS23_9ACTN|nr:CDP-glycerol glycerophosphotransferase family protein [Natronoglycomyces albus]QSB05060.1 CDP-glycerol glycerophosphotransferase family protein [Natronoglycomyces albus]
MMRTAIQTLFWRTMPVGLPGIAVIAFAATEGAWIGWALCLVGLLFLWRKGKPAHFASQTSGIVALVLTVLVGASATGHLDLGLAVAATLLAFLATQHDLLVKPFDSSQLTTANLSFSAYRPRISPHVPAFLCTALLTGLIATAAFKFPGWPIGILAGVGTLSLLGVVIGEWRRRRQDANYYDAAVHRALNEFQPQFAVHFTAPEGAEYQLAMWLPYLEALGDRFIVILRDPQPVAKLSALTSSPIVVAPRIVDLERCLVPSVRSVFYVNNGMMNTHAVRFSDLNHVQLLHGDSDKPSSYSPVTAMYSHIFVAGQAGIDRYRDHGVNIPHEKFHIVGRPQVADIEVDTTPIDKKDRLTVLYAPTWTGNSSDVNYCSLPYGHKIIDSLIAHDVDIILRPHPFSRRNLASAGLLAQLEDLLAHDSRHSDRNHTWGPKASNEMSLTDCFNASDALVCDVSAVAPDWLYSQKPFAITDVVALGDTFAQQFPLARASYLLNLNEAATKADDSDVHHILGQMLTVDPLKSVRAETKAYYLGNVPPERYKDTFLDAARATYAKERKQCPAPTSA